MKYILPLLLLMSAGCVRQSKRNISGTPVAVEDTESRQIAGDTVRYRTVINIPKRDGYTVEDTVRYQIGVKLYGLEILPTDSITVIDTYYSGLMEEERKLYGESFEDTMYREYHFIVHNRHTEAHRIFEAEYLDAAYQTDSYRGLYDREFRQRFDVPSEYIDPVIKEFNGHWVHLTEHNGEYYLNKRWDANETFLIADSTFSPCYQDGPDPWKILEAVPLPDGDGIAISGETFDIKIKAVDKDRSIYHAKIGRDECFIAPARAIHNFEIIQHVNNTGELM